MVHPAKEIDINKRQLPQIIQHIGPNINFCEPKYIILKQHSKERFFNDIEASISDSSSNNPRFDWKMLNMLVKNNKNCETIPLLCTEENGVEINFIADAEKANGFNIYFVSISTVDS